MFALSVILHLISLLIIILDFEETEHSDNMLSYLVVGLLAYLSEASCREIMRSIPTITNSLVNLGKMEISLYFNESPAHHAERTARKPAPFFLQNHKSEPITDEPCPCSTLRNVKDSFLSNPTGLLNKILTHNNLFSFNREPVTSTLCCESHEQESTVVFEFPNNPKNVKPFASRSSSISAQSNAMPIPNNRMPVLPYLFDTLIPNNSMLSPLKTKSIEIFLFPKKKDVGSEVKRFLPKKKDLISKDNIQIVGDKELKNDVLLFKPQVPVVKKDLDLQVKKEKEKKEMEQENQKADIEKEGDQIIIEPASKPNAL